MVYHLCPDLISTVGKLHNFRCLSQATGESKSYHLTIWPIIVVLPTISLFPSFHLENLKQIGEHIEHTCTNPFANPAVELHRLPLLAPAVRAIDAVRCFFGPESWLGQQRN